MNNIIFDRRKKFPDRDSQAYYHKDYARTMFVTMNKQNRTMRIDTAIQIILHEQLHDVLTRWISEKASIAIDNKWPHDKLKILRRKLKLGTY